MDKSKIISIVLLLVILGIGFVAFTFYSEKQSLFQDNEKIKRERVSLIKENNDLKYKFNRAREEADKSEKKLAAVQEEFSRLQEERSDWKDRWEKVSRERDELAEKAKKVSVREVSIVTKEAPAKVVPEENWVDFVEKKIALEVGISDLRSELLDAKNKIVEFENINRELNVQIDQIAKEKQKLQEDISFKEKAMRIMSISLVNEREERGKAVSKLRDIQAENIGLKRELVTASSEKMKLQKDYTQAVGKKIKVENRIMDVENVLKEKSIALEQLQGQLKQVIEKGLVDPDASVELPPIVVRPQAAGSQKIQGEVIAINAEEKFIVVDIGESSGARPGVLLKVTRGNREIGEVEIIETRKEISAADIKKSVSGFTIQEGDSVISK